MEIKVFQMWSSTVAFGFLFVSQLVSSQLEGDFGGFHFTIPDVRGNFDDAASWCKKYNSTLADVYDSSTQMALAQFLNTSNLTTMLYINISLSDKPYNTWFLINGSQYHGIVANQDYSQYFLNCRLRYDTDGFKVEASASSDFRNYICDYEESKCPTDSSNSIVYNERYYMKYENESLTWFIARERCTNNSGDLAQFQTTTGSPPFNTSWLNSSLTYWVGIRWNDRSWKSSDCGDEYIFTSWSTGKPNNYYAACVFVDPNGSPPWSWTDSYCTTKTQFVCLRRTATLSTVTISKTTTTATASATLISPTSSSNCVIDDNGACRSICPQTYGSEALTVTVGLVLGLAAILPLIIIIVVLIVVILRQRREPRALHGHETVNRDSKNTSATDGGSQEGAATQDAHYQHLRTDSRPTTIMPQYDQLNQPEIELYEPIS